MKYLLIITLFVSGSAFAQLRLPTNETGQVQYQEIVRVPNEKLPARQLMNQLHDWAEFYYESESAAEQQYDPEHNIQFIKSAYHIDDQIVRYTLTVEAKFGRYRATITDLIAEDKGISVPVRASSSTAAELERASGGKITNRKLIEQAAQQQAELYRQIDKSCRGTLASLKQYLTTLQK
ncbi:DUF4468 domain-containing protein [Spirosoma foliorum]|uniref:DUF4468 domain-containing protein n=1 Tax=Spirosoma foliorum TaxID=2710596 RepID=A0A7G5GX66_9BACT|nr:DUF4468 domain-containing protein [Spirosoma foliorum]QMW03458.1 DUF4468 domain-containing protein [Spirosoma foliorum]